MIGKKLYDEFILIYTTNINIENNDECRQYYINLITKTKNKIENFDEKYFI